MIDVLRTRESQLHRTTESIAEYQSLGCELPRSYGADGVSSQASARATERLERGGSPALDIRDGGIYRKADTHCCVSEEAIMDLDLYG